MLQKLNAVENVNRVVDVRNTQQQSGKVESVLAVLEPGQRVEPSLYERVIQQLSQVVAIVRFQLAEHHLEEVATTGADSVSPCIVDSHGLCKPKVVSFVRWHKCHV